MLDVPSLGALAYEAMRHFEFSRLGQAKPLCDILEV